MNKLSAEEAEFYNRRRPIRLHELQYITHASCDLKRAAAFGCLIFQTFLYI
jgi:hypothetical protein